MLVFRHRSRCVQIGLSQRAWKLDGQVNKAHLLAILFSSLYPYFFFVGQLFASTWLDHSTVIAGSKNNKVRKNRRLRLVGYGWIEVCSCVEYWLSPALNPISRLKKNAVAPLPS